MRTRIAPLANGFDGAEHEVRALPRPLANGRDGSTRRVASLRHADIWSVLSGDVRATMAALRRCQECTGNTAQNLNRSP